MPQFIIRTSKPARIAQLFTELDATLEPLSIGDAGGKGGGAPLAKGFAAPINVDAGPAKTGVLNQAARADHKHRALVGPPVTVIGPTNAEGTSVELARADHQHRLEVLVAKDSAAVSAKPALNFTGNVNITDSAAQANIDIPADSLGTTESTEDEPISGVLTTMLTLNFNVPAGDWQVEVYVDATCALAYPGDVSATAQTVSYQLQLDGTPVALREVGIGSTQAISQTCSISAHGRRTLSFGTYTAIFEASTTVVGASTATMRWRYMGVRLLRRIP